MGEWMNHETSRAEVEWYRQLFGIRRWFNVAVSRSQVHHRSTLNDGRAMLTACSRLGIRLNVAQRFGVAWYIDVGLRSGIVGEGKYSVAS